VSKSRTSLTHRLRESLTIAREAVRRQVSVDEVADERLELQVTRRNFLGAAAGAAAGLALSRPARSQGSGARIVVVGAGLAGLRFAHAMWTVNGIATAVYEANTRLGGRCWTNRDFFTDGLIAEHGGELINSNHTSMRNLAAQFGLQLANVNGGSEFCCPDVCWLDGAYYTMKEMNADMKEFFPVLNAANAAAPFHTLFDNYTPEGYRLDHTSAVEWIEQVVPGGSSGKLGRILQTALLCEYGGEPGIQPALNLVYLITGYGTAGLSGGNEKYHVIDGNDQIVSCMAAALPQGSIRTGMLLIALKNNDDGTYTCTFSKDSASEDVIADHVVLGLPFPQLKRVDLSAAGFSPVKMAAVNNYALGTNAKLALQFNRRPWAYPDGYSGVCYTAPQGIQVTWDATVSQKGPPGILLRFPGGNAGGAHAFPGAAAHCVAPAQPVQEFLNAVDAPFPGCREQYTGVAWLDCWAKDPFIGGAYGCYRVGNWTEFAGIENVRQGNVHFCGEQTDLAFQGYMEGAVRSAERLAFHWPNL